MKPREQEKEIYTLLSEKKKFSSLSTKSLKILASHAIQTKLAPHQTIWKFGDSGLFFVLICSGLVEVTRPCGIEDETCMGIFGPDDIIGLSALLKNTPFPGTAKTLLPTEVIKFYIHPSLEGIADPELNPELSLWYRENLLRHEQILREKIDILTAGTAEERLFEFIKHFLRRFGTNKVGAKFEIRIQMTKSKAARLMGLRTETTIRLINDWQKRGLIKWNKDQITLQDLELIERFIIKKKSTKS